MGSSAGDNNFLNDDSEFSSFSIILKNPNKGTTYLGDVTDTNHDNV